MLIPLLAACHTVAKPDSSPQPAPAAPVATSNTAKGTKGYPPGVDLNLIAQGYKVAQRNGEFVYCRKEAVTGSRFTQRTCFTAQQISDDEQRAKEALMHGKGTCVGQNC